MKKILFFLLCCLFFFNIIMPVKQAHATGVLQLIDYQDTTYAMQDYAFSNVFNFLYSGDSIPEVQLVGTNLPEGAVVGEPVKGGGALYSFTLSGQVKKSGNYSLILILTDNKGTILTQPHTLKVIAPSFNIITNSLKKFDLNSPYSDILYFEYFGYFDYQLPEIYIDIPNVEGLPEGMTSKFEYQADSSLGHFGGKGHVTISKPKEVNPPLNHYSVTVVMSLNNSAYTFRKDYSLDKSETSKSNAVIPTSIDYNEPLKTTQLIVSNSQTSEMIADYIKSEKEKSIKIDENLCKRLRGKILLQTENHGEAWYVNPKNCKKYYMANGSEAYNIMRDLGVGIKNSDLEKIKTNKIFAKRNSGKIFLQVEDLGQAFYVDFDGNAHYLKDGGEAYSIMRKFGLGITNNDLRKIDVK